MSILSKEQQAAFDNIAPSFEGEKPTSAILTGAAGTGKTFLCDRLSDALNPQLCALTNKAAAILAEATGREVVTLAKILKQRKFNDNNTGKSHFSSSGEVALEKSTLFIDESSMMNKSDLEQVQAKICPSYNVLFVGDKYQLPPVREDSSQAFEQDLPKHSLTEPQRFDKDSGIAALAVAVRTQMEDRTAPRVDTREILRDHGDVEFISQGKAMQRMVADFKAAEDVDDVRVISFTNRRVELFNDRMKKEVTGDSIRIMAGDILMANSAYAPTNEEGDSEVLLVNNSSLLAHRVEEGEKDGIECFFVATESGLVVPVPKNLSLYLHKVQELTSKALEFPSGSRDRRVAFRQKFLFEESFADLRLSYAQTIHKSQGSSYKTTYLDLQNLDKTTDLGRRLLYTAITRASDRLVMFK